MVEDKTCRRAANERLAADLFAVMLQQTGSRERALEAVCGWFLSQGLRVRFMRYVFGFEIAEAAACLTARCGPEWEDQYPRMACTARRLGIVG